MSPEFKIAKAFENYLNTFDGPPLAFQGRPFLVDGRDYVRVGEVSTDPVRINIAHDQPHDRTGFLMLVCVYNVRDGADYALRTSWIANKFTEGQTLEHDGACVTITNQPFIMPGYEDDTYWCIPIRIPWRCFI